MRVENYPQITVIVDTREQAPLNISMYETELGTLPVGDYGIKNFSDWNCPDFIVERKSISDLVGSLTCGRTRFMREIMKLRQFRFKALLIEGTREDIVAGEYQSKASPASVIGSLDAICVRTGVHVFWCRDSEGAARQLESLVRQFARGIEKDWNRLRGRSV